MWEMETAFSIEEALAVIQARAREAPKGELLSALGGIHPDQFDENRYLTMAELNDAAPDHPVYLSISNWGQGLPIRSARKPLMPGTLWWCVIPMKTPCTRLRTRWPSRSRRA